MTSLLDKNNGSPAQSFTIEPCDGTGLDVRAMQTITVIDMEGGQVADCSAESAENPDEFLSTAVTIDCNESLRIEENGIIYFNCYRPMFRILPDEVGTHDLLFPCCRLNV